MANHGAYRQPTEQLNLYSYATDTPNPQRNPAFYTKHRTNKKTSSPTSVANGEAAKFNWTLRLKCHTQPDIEMFDCSVSVRREIST